MEQTPCVPSVKGALGAVRIDKIYFSYALSFLVQLSERGYKSTVLKPLCVQIETTTEPQSI
jgi:hypothetical protein